MANSTGSNCGVQSTGVIGNGGGNISDDASCGFGSSTGVNGDTIGDSVSDSNLALDPGGLANNGGPTDTIELVTGSDAIDAVPLGAAGHRTILRLGEQRLCGRGPGGRNLPDRDEFCPVSRG